MGTQFSASKTRNRSIPAAADSLTNVADHVVGIARVADGVRAAQEHLEEDVGDLLAELGQAVPRVFLEEPHRGVEGGPAPHLDREHLRADPGVGVGHAEHVAGPDPGGQERLVGVAERGVGQEQRLLLADPARERLRPQLLEDLPRVPRAAAVDVVVGRGGRLGRADDVGGPRARRGSR